MLGLAALMASVIALASPQDQPAATPLSDIVVEGVRRDESTAQRFVAELAAPVFDTNTLAVWTSPVCLSLDNLRPGVADVLRARFEARVRRLGLSMGAPGCEPNVLIVFSADADATAQDMVSSSRLSFRPTAGPSQLDSGVLRRFVESDAPVRWWTVSMPVDVETGRRTVTAITDRNGPVGRSGPPVRRIRGMQPRGNNTRQILQWVIVVVDVNQTGETPLPGLTDYLTMVSLAQIDPSADMTRQSTVMNLFDSAIGVDGLTQWDQDYLVALYSSPVRWSNIRFQREEIARRMAAPVASTSTAPTP